MFNFNEFPALSEIGWGKFSTIYESRSLEDGTPLVVKTVRLLSSSAGFVDGVNIAHFERSVARQKAAASSGCSGILPIIDSGHDALVGFYVTHRYDRSLQDWIHRKIQPSPDALRHIFTSCVDILESLSRSSGVTHGNLNPSNVLCRGTLPALSIALTDLAPKGSLEDDLQALGKILYQLVMRREVEHIDWPVTSSNEWKVLQGEAETWRAFCNLLLDQSAAKPLRSFEDLKAAIPKPPKTSKRSKIILLSLGVLLLAGVASLPFAAKLRAPPAAPISIAEWNTLCDSYNAWFGELCNKTNWLAKWERDPFLNKQITSPLLKLADGNALKERFNPRTIIDPHRRNENKDLKQFAVDLPNLSADGLDQTHRAIKAVSLIQESLQEWRRSELTKLFGEIKTAAVDSKYFDSPSPITWDENLLPWVEFHLDLISSWSLWREQAARLSARKDNPFKAALQATLQDLERIGDFKEIGKRLQASSLVLKDLADFVTQNADHFEPVPFAELQNKFRGKALTNSTAKQWMAEAAGILEKPALWLGEIQTRSGAKRSPVIQAAWKARKEAALQGVTGTMLEKDRARFRSLKLQLDRLHLVLTTLDEELPSVHWGSKAPNPGEDALSQTLLKIAADIRERAASRILESLPSTDTFEAKNPLHEKPGSDISHALESDLQSLAQIPPLMQRLATLLQEGASLSEGVQDTGAQLQTSLSSIPAFQPLLATPEVSQSFSVLKDLQEIAASDATQLSKKIRSPNVSVAIAAFTRLSQISPARSLADWQTFKTALNALHSKIQTSVPAVDKRTRLLEQTSSLITTQWLSAFRAYNKDEMLELLNQKNETNIPDAVLSDTDQFNLLLLKIQSSLAKNQALDAGEVRDSLVREIEKLKRLPSSNQSDVQRFTTDLRSFSFSKNRKTASNDRGPGQRGWQSNPVKPEQFTWQSHTFNMIRVENPNGTSFYLADKTVSIGLVSDWLRRSDARPLALPPPPPNRIPTVWTSSGQSITPAPDWFGSFNTAQFPKSAHYPEGFNASTRPQNDTPMVYISAENAAALAGDMGFRLPTEEEWLRALSQARVKDASLSNFNLRDATWNAEQEHLRNYASTHALDGRPAAVAWLDGAIFRPDPGSFAKNGRQNAVPEHSGRDGFLWFAPVDQGGQTGGFFHLIGNVAQYIKSKDSENYLVGGGSALSEPGAHDRTHPVAKSGPGFADVGLRLALSADFFEDPDVSRFKEMLRKASFLQNTNP
ncbi:MAG: SUMF1/EgtB/PvdO family nonheme iron enzyme [Verrucomicrobiota bacterium]